MHAGRPADGKTLFYIEVDSKSSSDIYGLPFGEPVADRKPVPLVMTAASERWPMLSTDQRWLAYESTTERGPSEIILRPYPNVNSAIHPVTIGAKPRWAPDGRAIYYWRDSRMFRVSVTKSPHFKSGNPEEIITGVLPITNGDLYDIAPDGKRFVVAKTDEGPLLRQYRLVVNWIEEVKARAGQRR
jgi:WD40-like Beta Propeller Repeat